MKIKSIEAISSSLSRCISVDSPNKLFAIGENANLLTHNSVCQRNIINSCLLRPDKWVVLGIDLKRVELSPYREFGVNVATELGVAVDFLRFSQAVMMTRYERLESEGKNNFLDLDDPGQALLVMVDEAGELLSPSGVKTDEGKEEDALKGEAQMIIGSIARLGRAAGVHLVIATQRPDAKLLGGETRSNLAARIGCGTLEYSASQMLFGDSVGMRTPSNPKGGIYIKIYSKGNRGQGFFAPETWLGEYLKEHPEIKASTGDDMKDIPDSTPSKEDKFNALEEWDDDMDEILNAGDE